MSISRSEKKVLKEDLYAISRGTLYLITEMNKHVKYFQEHKCFNSLMTVIDDIHFRSAKSLNFVNNEESEEESYVEEIDETKESEEDNSEDVAFLGSNKENNGSNN